MKKISAIIVAVALLWMNSAFSQGQTPSGKREVKAFFFYNGLPTNITEAYLARAEICDVFLCGKWFKVDEVDRVFPPHEAALLVKIPTSDRPEVVCVWDMRLVTQPPGGGPTKEHIFKGMNFCTPEGSTVSFSQGRGNTYALQVFRNAEGRNQRITIAGIEGGGGQTEALGRPDPAGGPRAAPPPPEDWGGTRTRPAPPPPGQ